MSAFPAGRTFPNVEVLQSRAITALFSVIRDQKTPMKEYVIHCDRLLTILAEEGLANPNPNPKHDPDSNPNPDSDPITGGAGT